MSDQISSLFGLVLAGGQSRRMNQDKATLTYHGESQIVVASKILKKYCDKVFLSTRRDQADLPEFKNFLQIWDENDLSGIGPLGGILSAMRQYPKAAWLVLACDLPFIKEETLDHLLANRNPEKTATVYKSAHDGLPEPLCAIYEPSAAERFEGFHKNQIHCPRKILQQSDVEYLTLTDKRALDNINTPEDYQEAKESLSRNDK
jgi:molybdenum cofactor guanylyltransferase